MATEAMTRLRMLWTISSIILPTKYKLYFVVSIPLFGCETCTLHAVKECRKLASEAHVSTQARLSMKRLCFRANQR
ncbi:hypothetical protein DPMN_108585 [Dreissena polymorpha]|uniref:Uncharacterized protein n=1 Tax=Dreissena polymorpha TaxID=45954 RepID=A0A9D4K8T7_DREPO|nr:hypothetical protein DPMN_108585 [Dreissena polymorpha]